MNVKPRFIDFSVLRDPLPTDPAPPEYIMPGRYQARILSVVERQSSRTKLEYYVWEIMILSMHVHQDFRINYITSLTDRALYKLQDLVEAVLHQKMEDPLMFDPNRLVGRDLEIAVRNELYQNKEYSTIAHVYPFGSVT